MARGDLIGGGRERVSVWQQQRWNKSHNGTAGWATSSVCTKQFIGELSVAYFKQPFFCPPSFDEDKHAAHRPTEQRERERFRERDSGGGCS